MRTGQHSLTESPIQKETDSQKAYMHSCLSNKNSGSTTSQNANCFFRHPPGQALQKAHLGKESIADCFCQFPPAQPGTRRDILTESPHENPPAQPHRKPNPERDRLTQKATMRCCFRFCLGPVEDDDHCRRCQSSRWNPSMLELKVVLGWPSATHKCERPGCAHTSEHP